MEQRIPFIVSHTDLDGVVSAAVAWHARKREDMLPRVVLTGYGEVDFRIAEGLERQDLWDLVVLDLICQKSRTADYIDTSFRGEEPFLFDHHETSREQFGNRPWARIDTSCCAAMVYYHWLMEQPLEKDRRDRIAPLEDMVRIANDRDIWIGERPEGRLWHSLVTLCGPWSVFSRLTARPTGELTSSEREVAEDFVARQEARFALAKEKVRISGGNFVWVGPDLLEFGDVSDFCGLFLDREEHPPRLVAVAAKKTRGDWAVSLRSRNGLAGKLVGLMQDGRKIRGGGHEDAAALYYPASYSEMQIRDTLLSGMRAADQQNRVPGQNLGELLKRSMEAGS